MEPNTEQDEEPTIVIFRYWHDAVIALFPEIPSDEQTWIYCSSYMHIGQHSGASYLHIIQHSRPATPEEYAKLKHELESDPYNYQLIVRQHISQDMTAKRQRTWDDMMHGGIE